MSAMLSEVPSTTVESTKETNRKRKCSSNSSEVSIKSGRRSFEEVQSNNETPYCYSDTIPIFHNIGDYSRVGIKKTLLEYIALVKAQITVGWRPTVEDAELYCIKDTMLNPEIASLFTGSETIIKATKEIREYVTDVIRNIAKVNFSYVTSSVDEKSNEERNAEKCLRLLELVPIKVLQKAIEYGVPMRVIELYASINDGIDLKDLSPALCFFAMAMGHFDLAVSLIKKSDRKRFKGLRDFISRDNQLLLKRILVKTLRAKKLDYNFGLEHLTAIYSKENLLSQVIIEEDDCFVETRNKWTPIHYASVCANSKPLEFFLRKVGFRCVTIKNKNHETPLHCAARAGRLHNVKLILEAIEKEQKRLHEENEAIKSKLLQILFNNECNVLPSTREYAFVSCFVNQRNVYGDTAYDLAVEYNRHEVAQILRKLSRGSTKHQ